MHLPKCIVINNVAECSGVCGFDTLSITSSKSFSRLASQTGVYDCQPLVASPAATSLTRASTVLPLSLAANRQSNTDTLGYPVCGISEAPIALQQLRKGVADPWLK